MPYSWACNAKALAWPWSTRPLNSKAQRQQQQKKQQLLVAPPINSSPFPALSAAPPLPAGKEEGDGQGGCIWLPTAPLVPRPRALYNAASLAYLGDCIYETGEFLRLEDNCSSLLKRYEGMQLYVRCHFLSPPQAIDKYNTLVMGLVCCEAQDVFLKMLLKDDFLSEEERDIVRWGKNVQTNHKRATKRAGAAVYSRASSLETLIGYLYLTKPSRLQEVMNKMGLTWSTATSVENMELRDQCTV
eukprot:c19403_g1_i3 orf=60-791(+)